MEGKGWWMGRGVAVKDAWWGGVIKESFQKHLKTGWVKPKVLRRREGGWKVSLPLPPRKFLSYTSQWLKYRNLVSGWWSLVADWSWMVVDVFTANGGRWSLRSEVGGGPFLGEWSVVSGVW